jgi:threonine aldolase
MSQSRLYPIDLVSDNAAQPTEPMRSYMAKAPVGDEEFQEDPTVRALEELSAQLLGKEAALFLPSGTMCNIVSYFLYCAPDQGILIHEASHPVYSGYVEPQLARGRLQLLPGARGFPSSKSIDDALAEAAGKGSGTARLLSLENTHNRGGGTVWPLQRLREACETARSHRLATHLDGARLPNAAAASGIPMSEYAATFDSVWFDLSKGLGCPSGAVLASNGSFIQEARRAKYLFGGLMHKAGILAAAGIYAMHHHMTRLPDDHAVAQQLAQGLADIPGISVQNPEVQTNIVYFHTDAAGGAAQLVERLKEAGVRMKATSDRTVRAVTHLDIRPDDIARTVEKLRSIMGEADRCGAS